MNSSLLLVLCFALTGAHAAAVLSLTPSAAEVNFTECKSLSIELIGIARRLYNEVESPKIASIIDDPPVSIGPNDSCDPVSLQRDNKTCQSRIKLALKNYTRIFHNDGVFKNSACSKWRESAKYISVVTRDLLRVLKEPVVDAPLTTVDWYDKTLCRDSVERLYSFSIISARIFSFLASLAAPTVEMTQC